MLQCVMMIMMMTTPADDDDDDDVDSKAKRVSETVRA